MVMDQWCLPWWHNQLTTWKADTRPITDCPAKNDQVPCRPVELLREAEETARLIEIWPAQQPLSIQVYSLARNLASEDDGRSTPEELVVVGEALINESVRRQTSPAQLLMSGGTYGRGPNRFSATDKDPTAGHLLIASFILSGQTKHFARGASAFVRPMQTNDMPRVVSFLSELFAEEKWGWAGHYPNVDIRRLVALVPLKETTLDQATLNQQAITDLTAGKSPPVPQTTCPPPWVKQPTDWKKLGKAAAVAAVGSLLAAGTAYAVAETGTKRWKDWEPTERPEIQPPQPAQLTPGD